MGRIFAAACALFLGGCATALSPETIAHLDRIGATASPPASQSGVLTITEQRDPDATRLRPVPVGIAGGFSCNLGVGQLGDTAYAADRIARLENALAAAFPNPPGGATVIVRRYDIYLNHSQETNSETMNAAFGGGVIAAAIAPMPNAAAPQITRRPRCERERMRGGWFDATDLTNNFPPVTVEIEANVFGQDYAVNSAYSPEINLLALSAEYAGAEPSVRRATEAVLQRAMDKANTRLVDVIRAANQ